MKKRMKVAVATAAMAAMMSMSVFAGQWLQNSTGWWYDYGNGTYPANSWQWIDGNGDGIAECYYFDQYGYCLMNTSTPDNYTVNADGAWTVNGAVQTRSVAGTAVNQNAQSSTQQNNTQQNTTNSNVQPVNLADMDPVAKSMYSVEENVRTSQNALWGDAIELSAFDSYVEYYTGKQYGSLNLTFAPEQGFDDNEEWCLEIYGDDDMMLDSYTVNYKTPATDISVDVSGQDYVKLFWVRTSRYGNGDLIMKNAQFR